MGGRGLEKLEVMGFIRATLPGWDVGPKLSGSVGEDTMTVGTSMGGS